MLKGDFHNHCKGDLYDFFIKYSAKELISHAAKLGFEVLAITPHAEDVIYNETLKDYAKSKNILLIPACEAYVEGRHTLLYNFTKEEISKIKTFSDLKKVKRNYHMVIGAHPFYPHPEVLGEKLIENLDLFDAIEHCHFYHRFKNYNKKAVTLANKHSLPLVGTSDTHFLIQMGSNYTLLDADKTVEGVIEAIKNKNIKLITKPLSTLKLAKLGWSFFNPVMTTRISVQRSKRVSYQF